MFTLLQLPPPFSLLLYHLVCLIFMCIELSILLLQVSIYAKNNNHIVEKKWQFNNHTFFTLFFFGLCIFDLNGQNYL